jgi:pilus retraction protein PilT
MPGNSVLKEILELGVQSNASDWHIRENAPITLRIESELVDSNFVADSEYVKKAVDILIRTDEWKARLRRTGDLDLSYVEEGVGRFRVNVHRQKGMTSIAMRHVRSDVMDFNALGVPKILQKIAESQRGIIIVSGTTGSGKSTTLAAMIQHINMTFRKHIITIEDPIEYDFKDDKSVVEQREVGLDTETFYSALVHVLRQDPDVIMIGEMRNRESFDAALQASDTGHLVFTTLHSTNASQSVTRILDFYEKTEQDSIRSALAVNIRAVCAQRLLPRAFGGGVIPAVEIMINSPMVHKLLIENKLDKLPAAVENGRDDGMQSFNQSLLGLINEGLVTEEDALKAASNPEALKMNLRGIFLDSKSEIMG